MHQILKETRMHNKQIHHHISDHFHCVAETFPSCPYSPYNLIDAPLSIKSNTLLKWRSPPLHRRLVSSINLGEVWEMSTNVFKRVTAGGWSFIIVSIISNEKGSVTNDILLTRNRS